MINIKFFSDLLKKYSQYNHQRHEVIKFSSDVLRLSKQTIFNLHRNQPTEAEQSLTEAEKILGQLDELFKKDGDLKTEGSFIAAVEEYVEAKFFKKVIENESIDYLEVKPIIGYDEYLSGICDLTGEITRRAILLATDGKSSEVIKLKKMVEEIIGQLIKFDLVGKLRVKYDEAKRNLKRIEEIVYDLKIRKL